MGRHQHRAEGDRLPIPGADLGYADTDRADPGPDLALWKVAIANDAGFSILEAVIGIGGKNILQLGLDLCGVFKFV